MMQIIGLRWIANLRPKSQRIKTFLKVKRRFPIHFTTHFFRVLFIIFGDTKHTVHGETATICRLKIQDVWGNSNS
jgi:hypothetical protein